MTERIQAIRGMNDVLPDMALQWRYVERLLAMTLHTYGYQEIRMPLIESTSLFKRTIGEITDIVEKEMYTFNDLNGDSITLRPEGTAGCVRACLEHGLLHNQSQKLWYQGAMFRHEKPQKGRYRQFHQLGVEALGIKGVGIELELIAICQRFWHLLGIQSYLSLEINTIGTIKEREEYRRLLVDYLKPLEKELDEDSQRRLTTNPLRILDSKDKHTQKLLASAPTLMDVLSPQSKQHFNRLCEGLYSLGIDYTINPKLVRGLDYYSHTVFEWVTKELGSQATVCAGGRYDSLVEQLGGKPTPATGFALGFERLLLLLTAINQGTVQTPADFYFITVDDDALNRALVLAEKLRSYSEQWTVVVHLGGGSFKSQFKKADKSGAHIALILGAEELQEQTVSLKDLRTNKEQITIPQQELYSYIKTYLQ